MIKHIKKLLWWLIFFFVVFSIFRSFIEGDMRLMFWQLGLLVIYLSVGYSEGALKDVYNRLRSSHDLVDALLRENKQMKDIIQQIEDEKSNKRR